MNAVKIEVQHLCFLIHLNQNAYFSDTLDTGTSFRPYDSEYASAAMIFLQMSWSTACMFPPHHTLTHSVAARFFFSEKKKMDTELINMLNLNR